jgi:hypothetical protein
MLGYSMIPGATINAGISRWAGAEGEDQVAYGDGLPLQTIATYGAPAKVDTTGPSVTSVGSSSVTDTSASIDRVAGEPATMKVEYGTTSGVYTNTENNTVLNASKSVGLSGLSASTTYYYRATSYDGYANGTVSAEGSFTTAAPPCTAGKPSLTLGSPSAYWGSYADYLAHVLTVDWAVSNTGATTASNVAVTGSTPTWGGFSTITAMPISLGTIIGGGSATATVQYQITGTAVGFRVVNTGSADDCAANSYTYP